MAGGLSVALGYRARIGGWLIVAFLVFGWAWPVAGPWALRLAWVSLFLQ
jgi:hypothetical protein